MTAQFAHDYVKQNNAQLQAMYDSAPEFDDGFADTDSNPAARGFAAFREYMNQNGRPKVADRKEIVPFRLPPARRNVPIAAELSGIL
jgi:hypothetical protein